MPEGLLGQGVVLTFPYDQTTVYQLFRLVDWMIRLPKELEEHYTQALQVLEQEHAMTYITTPERVFLRRVQKLLSLQTSKNGQHKQRHHRAGHGSRFPAIARRQPNGGCDPNTGRSGQAFDLLFLLLLQDRTCA